MDPSLTQQPQKQSPKAEALKHLSSSLNPSPFSSSISKLSGSSRAIPCNKDFHFYFNFEEFKNPIQGIAKNSQSILETIGSSAEKLWGKKQTKFPNCDIDDDDEAYDWLVNFNDELFERFDASVDEFKKVRNKEEETGVRFVNGVDDDGFQLVQGRKKKASEKDLVVNNSNNSTSNSSSVKVVSRDSNAMGTPKAKVSFHIASIRRPQDEYKILVNNSNLPFEHVWLQRSEDGSRFVHPLEKLSVLDFIDKTVRDVDPVKPPPVESTSFKLVQEVRDLKDLAAKLRDANEFAVDLEHNQYRSFQGLTCLMQISTRTEDFIVDTLKLRVHIGPYLREVFKDPTKRKVMHGADRDIIWLQRDFGIYVCNMFDTGQASKVLKLERNSLEYLLRYFCDVAANKEYQNADWRLRPLTDEMLRYATEDTHYLLYIYDVMRRMLLSSSTDPECPEAALVEVYQRSYDLCMQLYQKELLTETSYLNIYGLHAADLSGQQLAIVAGLCEWRDVIARAEDESTGYILPNKALIEIAKQMPVTPGKLRHVLKSRHPYIERNLGSVVSIIRHSMQNAAAFEEVAKKLKEEHIEMMAARNARYANAEDTTEVAGSASVSNACEGDSFEKEVGNFIAGINQNNKLDGSSASRVSIQVQKKPSSAFGSMFGNTAGKRKFNPESKATEEIKVEQIKSSVYLPFRSFVDKTEPSHPPVVKECKEAPNVQPATTCSKPEDDIILLESDSDVEVEKPADSMTVNDQNAGPKKEDEDNVILLDSDSCSEEYDHGKETDAADVETKEDAGEKNHGKETDAADMETKGDAGEENHGKETDAADMETKEDADAGEKSMSLSDLSSSFQKCVQTADEKRKSSQGVEGSAGLVKVTPFDYAAARKEVRFGEDGSDGSEGEDGKQGKRERKKSGGGRKNAAAGERSGDFQMGRRSQAFPATGNRSSTFR